MSPVYGENLLILVQIPLASAFALHFLVCRIFLWFSVLNENICCGDHWNRIAEALPMSSHNRCFPEEIRKILNS